MLVTSVDEHYLWQQGRFLIQSCWAFAPEQRFFLHLINGSADTEQAIRKLHQKLIIRHEILDCPKSRFKGRMCCMRSQILVDILQEYQEPTVYLDSDIILKKELTELFAILEQHELAVLHRPEIEQLGACGTRDAGKFNSGVIAVAPTPNMLNFFGNYKTLIKARIERDEPLDLLHNRIYTAVDQELLYTLYEERKSEIDYLPLPKKFNDTHLQSGSAIWHGKGVRRNRLKWKLEQSKYRKLYPYTAVLWCLISIRTILRKMLGE